MVVAAAAALLFASGCGQRSAATRVVLITIDTLRPDHLSSYGYERATDRDLAWLAEEGVVFRDVSSTTSWTAPALASLMTSLHPHQHRVRDGSVTKFLQGDHRVVMQEVLPAEVTTLAEALAGAGFETIGLSASPHTTEALGFAHRASRSTRRSDPSLPTRRSAGSMRTAARCEIASIG